MSAMISADLLKRLLPPGAYDPNALIVSVELSADGAALDAAQSTADQILVESDPRTTMQMLSDWERVSMLADSCSANLVLSIEQRQAALTAKLTMKNGQSRAYFIAMAEKLGFPGATITEFHPMTCNDTCNDALSSEDDRFVWQINLPSSGGVFTANCNSDCTSSLASWGNAQVECAIRKFCPANTTPVFAYV